MNLPFTFFNLTQLSHWVTLTATGKRARQLSRACIGLIYLLLMGLTAHAQTTWTGTTSTDWATASNWSTGSVPTPTDDVVIPDVTGNDPAIGVGTTALANSVEVQSGGVLNILNSATLTINRLIPIFGVPSSSLLNGGTVNNSGLMVIGNSPYGLTNRATFINNRGGQIRIDGTGNRSLWNTGGGIFTNEGSIVIGAAASVGVFGLWNQATFTNNTGGLIQIDRCFYCLYNDNGGIFTNVASVIIGANTGVSFGLWNEATFTNNTGGLIQIDRTGARAVENRTTATFNNWARIIIGATASVGNFGLVNSATFNNLTGGQIGIDRSGIIGLLNDGPFTNEGSIIIGANAPVGEYGFQNGGTFNNKGCANLKLLAVLRNFSGASFTNGGMFTVNTTGVHVNAGLLTNNGVIVYPQGNPIPNVTNNELIVLPITATELTATPALQIGSNSSFSVATTWYQNPERTTVAGIYTSNTNTFTASGPGTHPVYFLITDPANKCSLPVSIPLTATGGSLVTGPASLCVKAAPPAHAKVTLPLMMSVSGNASAYTYHWSYKAPNSTSYKPISSKGITIGKVSFVPLPNAPSLNIVAAKGNLNGLQGYLIQLTVKQGNQVVGSAQTLLDGSCSLTIPGAREGVFLYEEDQIQVQMYANPFKETLQLELRGINQPAKVVLYDLQGVLRGIWSVESMHGIGQLKADVSALSQGLYLLQVETDEGVLHRQRVLKQR